MLRSRSVRCYWWRFLPVGWFDFTPACNSDLWGKLNRSISSVSWVRSVLIRLLKTYHAGGVEYCLEELRDIIGMKLSILVKIYEIVSPRRHIYRCDSNEHITAFVSSRIGQDTVICF